MFKCSNIQMFSYLNVQMFTYQMSNVNKVKLCSNIQMFKCSNIQMFSYSNFQMFTCQMSNIKFQMSIRLNFCGSVPPDSSGNF